MCQLCENDRTPMPVSVFLAGRPKAPEYRTLRSCLWNAYLDAQPRGVAPKEGKQSLYAQVKALPGVREERTARGRFFVGIAAV